MQGQGRIDQNVEVMGSNVVQREREAMRYEFMKQAAEL
jgi:hypothetical protein